jgi:hypothetical protein
MRRVGKPVHATSINSSTLGLLVVGGTGGKAKGVGSWGECSQGRTGSGGGLEGLEFGLDFGFGEAKGLEEGELCSAVSQGEAWEDT